MFKRLKLQDAFWTSIFLFLLIFGLRIASSFYSIAIPYWQQDLAPFSKLFYHFLGHNLLQNQWFHFISTAILLFLQANILIYILADFKIELFKGLSLAWFYTLLFHLFPQYLFLSPQLLSYTFVLMGFLAFKQLQNQRYPYKSIFSMGLYIGIASAFWVPAAIFFIIPLYILYQANLFNLRHFILCSFGFLLPFIYLAVFAFLFNKNIDLLGSLHYNRFIFSPIATRELLSVIVLGVLIIASIFSTLGFLSKQLKRTKAFFELVLLFVFGFLVLFFICLNLLNLIFGSAVLQSI